MNQGEIIIYQSADNASFQIDVRVENETVWLNRHQLAKLFDRDVKTIGKHINNALKEELHSFSVVANFALKIIFSSSNFFQLPSSVFRLRTSELQKFTTVPPYSRVGYTELLREQTNYHCNIMQTWIFCKTGLVFRILLNC